MAKEIIPIPTDLNIEKFDGTSITRMSSYIENGIIEEYPEGNKFVTQRPSFTTIEDASTVGGVVDATGRGIYYWKLVDNTYICNYDSVYSDSYATVCGGFAVAGSQRVYWAELADKLFMLDVQGNKGYYIDDGAPTTLVEIAHASFPDATNNRTLADGCVVLDGTLYVLANVTANNNAEIWGSALNDLTTWSGTNFLTASKNTDRGVYIGLHHSNIFVLGNESVEFFYNAGNATGSPLSARTDISYNIGCVDGKSVFVDNDEVFFVGKSTTSGVGVFKMSGMQIEKISPPSLDSYLSSALTIEGLSVMGSGLFAGGRTFYIVTLYTTSSNVITPVETIVYNSRSSTWTFWEHASSAVAQFPLVQWTSATSLSGSTIVTGKGVLSNGDYLECYDDFYPQDRIRGTLIYESGVFESGVYNDIAASGDQITMKVRIGHLDFDTRNNKFMWEVRPVCDSTEASQTLIIRYADDNHSTFSTDRTVNLNNANDKLTRLGRFRSRTFEIEYSGTEPLRLQGLEVNVTPATN